MKKIKSVSVNEVYFNSVVNKSEYFDNCAKLYYNLNKRGLSHSQIVNLIKYLDSDNLKQRVLRSIESIESLGEG